MSSEVRFTMNATPAQAVGLACDLVTLASELFFNASRDLAAAEGHPNRLTLEQHVHLTRTSIAAALKALPTHEALHTEVLRFFDEVTTPWLLAQHTPRTRPRLTLVPDEP